MGRVIHVEDDSRDRELTARLTALAPFQIVPANSAAALRHVSDTPHPLLVLLDLRLPDADGLDLIPELRTRWPAARIAVLSGFASVSLAVEATKRGADHVLEKSASGSELQKIVDGLLHPPARLALSEGPLMLSPRMLTLRSLVERVAPTDAGVLILGESGTGKEVVADLVHKHSLRTGPFVKINCAALPRELIESELFGAVKGSYTGSLGDRHGLFRAARAGSLLLDEISEMPIDTQGKLLRVLQEKKVRPVGGTATHDTDCRVVAASNRDMPQAIREGRLREDLYYRIATIEISLPPLRERREEILPLAHLFLQQSGRLASRPPTGFSPDAEDRLSNYHWPGNVRQLQSVVQRAAILARDPIVRRHDLTFGDENTPRHHASLNEVERQRILVALAEAAGNKTETARLLGWSRPTLYKKMGEHVIEI